MRHVPDLHAHADHDQELIAAHAAGDLAGGALATASDLLVACTSCAELHADLRAIAAATATVPAPRRTRDFRITPEQAERLRPSGWRRFLAAFAAPRLAFTAPLGSGLAALGIAGLLLTSVPGLMPAGGASTTGDVSLSATPAPTEAGAALVPEATADVRVDVDGEQPPRDDKGSVDTLGTGEAAGDPASDPAGLSPVQWASLFALVAGALLFGARVFARRVQPGA